jgi:hypothetical protein
MKERTVSINIPLGGRTPGGRRRAEVLVGLGPDGTVFFLPLRKLPQERGAFYLTGAMAADKAVRTFRTAQRFLDRGKRKAAA